MTMNQEPAQAGRAFHQDLVAAAPVIWLCASIFLSLRGLWQSGWAVFGIELPAGIMGYIYASQAAGVVQVLLGLYVLGLAWRRSPRFPFWFTVWASIAILADMGFSLASLFIGAFSPDWSPWLIVAVSVAISVWTIMLVRSPRPMAAATAPAVPAGPVPVGVLVLNAVLGLVLGGAAGLGVGLLAGSVIVDWLDVSCFEGGCGYAAAAIGLLGLILGAIGGPIFAVLRTRRARRA